MFDSGILGFPGNDRQRETDSALRLEDDREDRRG